MLSFAIINLRPPLQATMPYSVLRTLEACGPKCCSRCKEDVRRLSRPRCSEFPGMGCEAPFTDSAQMNSSGHTTQPGQVKNMIFGRADMRPWPPPSVPHALLILISPPSMWNTHTTAGDMLVHMVHYGICTPYIIKAIGARLLL